MKKQILYMYVEKATGEVVYIGIDTNGERHTNHMKPSKGVEYNPTTSNKEPQIINVWLQSNPDAWEYIEAATIEVGVEQLGKDIVYVLEDHFIHEYSPRFNEKKRGVGSIYETYKKDDGKWALRDKKTNI